MRNKLRLSDERYSEAIPYTLFLKEIGRDLFAYDAERGVSQIFIDGELADLCPANFNAILETARDAVELTLEFPEGSDIVSEQDEVVQAITLTLNGPSIRPFLHDWLEWTENHYNSAALYRTFCDLDEASYGDPKPMWRFFFGNLVKPIEPPTFELI